MGLQPCAKTVSVADKRTWYGKTFQLQQISTVTIESCPKRETDKRVPFWAE